MHLEEVGAESCGEKADPSRAGAGEQRRRVEGWECRPGKMKEPHEISGERSTQRPKESESGSGKERASWLDYTGLGLGES